METNRRTPQKFTCYFCNKTIENEPEMGHTAMCGSVLVPCPNKCGSYIQRMALKKHNQECVNRTTNSMPRKQKPKQEIYTHVPMQHMQQSMQQVPMQVPIQQVPVQQIPVQQLPVQVPNINYVMVPDTRHKTTNRDINGLVKSDNQEELYKLSRKLADLDSRFQFHQKNLQQNSFPIQNYENLKTAQLQLNLDIEKLKYQSQLAFDWRTKTDTILSTLRLNISSIENTKREVDANLTGLQNRIMLMEKLQDQISYLKESFLREQAYNRQVDMNFSENVEELKKLSAQDSAQSLAILGDVKDSLDLVKQDMEDAKIKLEDQGIKFTNIIYDLRGIGQSATDATKRIESLETELEETKRSMNQMKLDMEILESLSSSNDFRPVPGRLIWRITEVDTKMVQAKQTGNVIKSPIFFTHECGYRVRILLYFNGLKKWKDRYALLCLHVLKGDYDMILKWPCNIEGNITLRDLEDLEKAKPFTKLITAKRQSGNEECEEPQESSSYYIFIPHTTLLKSNYMKNDTIFLDIKIRQNTKLETSL